MVLTKATKKQRIFCFTGASGTGKSTLINYINDNFYMKAEELSAREYLPKNDSYDKTLTDDTQILISQHRFISICEAILNSNFHYVFSRGPIDNLAYQNALQKGLILDSVIEREVDLFKRHVTYLYLPIEFAMKDKEDVVRGQNELIQRNVDTYIRNYLIEKELPFYTIKGSIEQRQKQLDLIFSNQRKDHFNRYRNYKGIGVNYMKF